MENQVAEIKRTEVATQDFTRLAGEYLTAMGNKLNESQQTQFINICQSFGLNPFKREIYAVKYGETFNVITGYEVYLKRAERSGKLNGWNVRIEGVGAEMKAIITIYRKDWNQPFEHEVYLQECSNGKNLWISKPRFMLKKTAIGQGFRLCFPDELGGMPYTAEEIIRDEEGFEQVKEPIPQQTAAFQDEEKIILGEKINKSIFE